MWQNYKKPTKKTDVCPVCERAESLLKKTKSNLPQNLIAEYLEEYKAYEQHYLVAQHQREVFNYQKNNLEEGSCIIVLDFKQNIKLRGSKVETSRDFYRKTEVTVLGFCIYYKTNGETYKHHVNYISKNLSHDSFFTKKAIYNLLQNEFFI